MIDGSLVRTGDVALVLAPDGSEVLVRVVRDGMRPAGMRLDGGGSINLEGCSFLEINGKRPLVKNDHPVV